MIKWIKNKFRCFLGHHNMVYLSDCTGREMYISQCTICKRGFKADPFENDISAKWMRRLWDYDMIPKSQNRSSYEKVYGSTSTNYIKGL